MAVMKLSKDDAFTIMGALYERREALLPKSNATLMPEMFEMFRVSELASIDELLKRMTESLLSLDGGISLSN